MAVQLYGVPIKIINKLPQRFERKHYIRPSDIEVAYGLLRHLCLPDKEYHSEQINSVYFDTVELEQHARSDSGDFRKDKVRIRWYGQKENPYGIQTAFIELKSRRGFASTKQRLKVSLPADRLFQNRLREGIVSRTLLIDTLARFGYFPTEPLLPVIKISYWRYRFCEIVTGQRVSLDCHIRSTMILPGSGHGERELELPGGVIEIKGTCMELPDSLRHINILGIDWTRFSKYSACIDSHCESPGCTGRLSPSGRIVD